MNSPRAMTQLAVMLDKAGVIAPRGIRISEAAVIPVSQAFANSDTRKKVNIDVDKIMNEWASPR